MGLSKHVKVEIVPCCAVCGGPKKAAMLFSSTYYRCEGCEPLNGPAKTKPAPIVRDTFVTAHDIRQYLITIPGVHRCVGDQIEMTRMGYKFVFYLEVEFGYRTLVEEAYERAQERMPAGAYPLGLNCNYPDGTGFRLGMD